MNPTRYSSSPTMAHVPVDLLGAPWVGDAGPELANIYLHARYYDSSLGMFLSPDPSATNARQSSVAARALSLISVPSANDLLRQGVGTNLYSYGGGDPINRLDPSGLEWFEICDAWKIEERKRDDGVLDWILTDECNSWHTEWRDDPNVPEDEDVWKKRRDDKRKKREEEERCRTTGICSEEDFEKWMAQEKCKADWENYRNQTAPANYRSGPGVYQRAGRRVGQVALLPAGHPGADLGRRALWLLFGDTLGQIYDSYFGEDLPDDISWVPSPPPSCQLPS